MKVRCGVLIDCVVRWLFVLIMLVLCLLDWLMIVEEVVWVRYLVVLK